MHGDICRILRHITSILSSFLFCSVFSICCRKMPESNLIVDGFIQGTLPSGADNDMNKQQSHHFSETLSHVAANIAPHKV